MLRAFATTLFVIGMAGSVSAQECIELAKSIGRDFERYADSNQIEIIRTANLCTSRIESSTSDQRAQIQASYGLFSGGASGSDTQIKALQDQKCQNSFGYDWRSRITNTELDRVSQIGASAVQDCLSQKNFRLINLYYNGSAIAATYRYGGNGQVKINGVTISPPTIATCTALHNGKISTDLSEVVGEAINSGDTFTLSCSRNSIELADKRKRFEGGLIGVSTVADSPQFPLVRYDEPLVAQETADTLAKRIAELAAKEEKSEKRIAAIYKALSFGSNGTSQNVVFNGYANQSPCPPNMVIREVRITYQNITSSPSGSITCVNLKPEDVQ